LNWKDDPICRAGPEVLFRPQEREGVWCMRFVWNLLP